jgi:hypothetical protein
MINHTDVPYDDPETFVEIIQECQCVQEECASHGVGLHPLHRPDGPHPDAVRIAEETRHIVDSYPEYGS